MQIVRSAIQDIPVVTVGPGCMERREYHFALLGGPDFLNDFVKQGNGGNMNIEFPCQSFDRASIASARGTGIGDTNWGRCVLWTEASMHVKCWSFSRREVWVTISG